jgi:hypothetical protein
VNQTRTNQAAIFYKSLCFRLKISERAYQIYLNERTYATAHVILLANIDILSFLRDNSSFFSPSDREDFTRLALHFLGWISDFQQYGEQLTPNVDSIFIFDRSKGFLPYPKDFIERLYIDWYVESQY